ncbi:MAG: citramalate synthase, partial [Oscillospiraceae bacterium]|nr:citramalate synthase [Oscillospiraceae bacterium]
MCTIELLDTTLRDGAQSEGISFSVEDKLAIARELDRLGVGLIEVGNPGSNPKDREVFGRLPSLNLGAKTVAFGSTMRKKAHPEEDAGLAAMLESKADAAAIFGKCSLLHVREVLATAPEENARMIEQSCEYISREGRKNGMTKLIFDAEHFFDGFSENPDFALGMLEAAALGGADVLCLCDTNGGSFPDDISRITAQVREKFPHNTIGIHCHN